MAPGCGLWFPVAWLRPDALADERPWRALLEHGLSLLSDAGLGGERSAGLGGFRWRAGKDETWPWPQPGSPVVTLSRYHPREEELPAALEGTAVRYRLESVAGYLQSPGLPAQRRRRLWLVQEGSVISAVDKGVMGDVSDVRPQVGDFPHPVWRYGLAFPVPLEVPHA
jgi:CRISPR-associated protein Csm4